MNTGGYNHKCMDSAKLDFGAWFNQGTYVRNQGTNYCITCRVHTYVYKVHDELEVGK